MGRLRWLQGLFFIANVGIRPVSDRFVCGCCWGSGWCGCRLAAKWTCLSVALATWCGRMGTPAVYTCVVVHAVVPEAAVIIMMKCNTWAGWDACVSTVALWGSGGPCQLRFKEKFHMHGSPLRKALSDHEAEITVIVPPSSIFLASPCTTSKCFAKAVHRPLCCLGLAR